MSDIIKPKTVGYTIDKFAHIIGIIPSSYKYALTYEEQIFAIGDYLEKVVFPAINENAEALAELQGLFLQLKDYVDNYFDNLDVQEEINNKLDDMVTQGTMAEIINQEIFGELNSQVQQNTSDITKLKNQTVYINVLAEGIKNDGTDVSSDLQDLIDENTDGSTFYFPNGTYKDFFNSPKRLVPSIKVCIICIFQRSPINLTVISAKYFCTSSIIKKLLNIRRNTTLVSLRKLSHFQVLTLLF